MTKYTINKLFEKTFQNPIWKIEVDTVRNNLAIECRDAENTLPTFTVHTFEGKTLVDEYTVTEKEWTLETIQGDYLILKKYGTAAPIQAGIQIIHIPSKTVVATFSEYLLKEVRKDTIIAIHRAIPSGIIFYIDIETGKVSSGTDIKGDFYDYNINYPTPYIGKLPSFMEKISSEYQLFFQPYGTNFLWSYHQKTTEGYSLNLALSSKNEILDQIVVLKHLNKQILQPYFNVKNYIFFLSDTKQEIVTYLVLL